MGAIETAMKDARLIDWLRSTAASAGRVASICTGAFLLGETGLLAGRRATTHWSVADRLAKMSPTTRVDANALYIEDGHIWTSAGVSAGIDLALALVARDLGPRSEEHTSELQSLMRISYALLCLKKKHMNIKSYN